MIENLKFGSTNFIAKGIIFIKTLRSFSTCFSIPGRFTLTITCCPFFTARCTWPSDAPDSEFWSSSSNFSSILPMSFSIIGLTFSNETAGTLSCNLDNSSRYGCGKISARDESHCPNLIKTGPSEMHVFSIRCAFLRNLFHQRFFLPARSKEYGLFWGLVLQESVW